jgi:hypothetical protein
MRGNWSAEEVDDIIEAQRLRRKNRYPLDPLPPCVCGHPYHKGKECLETGAPGEYCRCEKYAEQGAQ